MKRFIFLMLCCLLLAGCWDVDEPDRMLYIFGLGVDYKDGEYIIHAQIIDFSNIAKSEQPNSPDAVQAEVGTAKGTTPSEAFYNLYRVLDEKLFWGHFSFVVFSENTLKDGRANILINTFIRFHETRYNTWVYVTKNDVKEVMLTTPVINKAISLSKLADPLNSYHQDSFTEPMNFRRLIIHLNEPGHETKIPLVSIYDKWETTKEEDTTYHLHGVAVITPDEFKGFIEDDDAAGLQWLSEKSIRSGITTETSTKEKMSVTLTNISSKRTAIVNDSTVQFDISVSVVATVSGFHGTITNDEIKQAVMKQLEKDIRQTYTKGLELDADVYRLSETLYREHVREWKKIEKDGKIPLDENSLRNISIHVTKVNSGRKTFNETVE